MFELKVEQWVTSCSCKRPSQPNTTVFDFQMQILSLLIFYADTHEGHMEALCTDASQRPGKIHVYFFHVALETLYSWGGGGLVRTLEMEILSLSFTIENANTFRSRMSLKHSEIWINHQTMFALSCCLVMLFQLFKGSGGGWAIRSTNASKQHSHVVQYH